MNYFQINGVTVMPPLCAEYQIDPTFKIQNDYIPCEQGHHFIYHYPFREVNDVTFNNYSNLYLTDKFDPLSIFEIQPVGDTWPETITTSLQYNSLSGTTASTDYLTIKDVDNGDNSSIKPIDITTYTDEKTSKRLPNEFYFEVVLVNGIDCLIRHIGTNKVVYYLYGEANTNDIWFAPIVPEEPDFKWTLYDPEYAINYTSGEKFKFQYTYDRENKLLRLFKGGKNLKRPELVDAAGDKELIFAELVGSDIYEPTDYTTIRIRDRSTEVSNIDFQTDYVSYDNTIDQNNVNIDNTKTVSNLANNMLFHCEYYYLTGATLPLNFINLKNQKTPKDTYSSSSPWDQYPAVDHREYNKIFSGTHQLQGNDAIYFDYSSNIAELELKPGLTYFNFPQQPDPVQRLNINDSGLVESGAIGGSSPIRGDKVFKKLSGYGDTTQWGNPSDEQTGTWLCSWLSAGEDITTKPVWVDRYYNPKKIGAEAALSDNSCMYISKYTSSNSDIFDGLSNVDMYDRESTLTFEPGVLYAYYRIGKTDVENNLKSLEPFLVKDKFDVYNTVSKRPAILQDNTYIFNKQNYGKVETFDKINETNDFSIIFELDCSNWKDLIGHQILGNYTNSGFGFFNENKITPFMYVPSTDGVSVSTDSGTITQGSSVKIYDSKFKLFNYFTNTSYLKDGDVSTSRALFTHTIVRESFDNIFLINTNQEIVEVDNNGEFVGIYNDWNTEYTASSTVKILNVTNDETYIYILTQTGATTYNVDTFNYLTKTFSSYTGETKIITAPEDAKGGGSSGRDIDSEYPIPNLIYIKDDPEIEHISPTPRKIYLAKGDSIKAGKQKLWVLVEGGKNAITQVQIKHDIIYGYDTIDEVTLDGHITDNNLNEPDMQLSVADYDVDGDGNIWIIHNSNVVTKLSSDRTPILTTILEDQLALSLVFTSEIINGEHVERLVVLTKTVGGDELVIPITDHPTNTSSHDHPNDYEHANFNESSTSPDTGISYPFIEGDARYPTGRVVDGEYSILTEDFNYLVEEVEDKIYGYVLDLTDGSVVETNSLTDFEIDSYGINPRIYNNYNYLKENYSKYYDNNFNLKMMLQPLFDSVTPEHINIKYDLDNIGAGKHNICLNFSSTTGVLQLYIDGIKIEERVFEPNKYKFLDIVNKAIVAGTSPFLRDILLFDKIKNNTYYTTKNINITNLKIYNKFLEYFDIVSLLRTTRSPDPLSWSLPAGSRNYVEGIERIFNHSLPPTKSNTLDIRIRNSSIANKAIQQTITDKIKRNLHKIVPGYTNVRNISWSNEIPTS